MVVARSLLLVSLLAACDRIYGLTGRADDDAAITDDTSDASDAMDAMETCPNHPDPAGDDDGDEITNQSDLCPDLKDTGNNEDGDCKADACDPCPQLYGDMQADPELDGIGEECDFARASATVDVRRFEGFDNADELELVNVAIDHSNATLRSENTMIPAFGWANDTIPTPFQIETQFVVPVNAAGSWSIGIIFGATNRGQFPNGWAVTLTQISPGQLTLRLFQVVNGAFFPQNMDRPVVAPDPRFRLGVRVEGRDITIEAQSGIVTDSQVIAFPNTLPGGLQGATSFGVTVASGAIGVFDYMTELHHQ